MHVSNQNNDIGHKSKCKIKNVILTILILFCSFVIGCFVRLILTNGEKIFFDNIDTGYSILILIFIGGLWIGLVFFIIVGCISCFIGLLNGYNSDKKEIIIEV